ncbi:sigma-70 family RNA polymerase sigma factor [Puteibacter caeruleilacunae]|nr:sigma-70 family RNA polymerase sigma factor [Puteibacter caeruleilacunae]
MNTNLDKEIWQRFKGGDEKAFAYIFDVYFDQLVDYGRRFTKDKQLIKDAVQDLFLELARRREKLSVVDNIVAYLLKSVRLRIFRMLEKANNSGTDDYQIKLEEFYMQFGTVEEKEDLEHKINHISTALNELPARQKEVLYLKFYKNLSNLEISEVMDLKYQSVGNTIQKALNKLRDTLGESSQMLLLHFFKTAKF